MRPCSWRLVGIKPCVYKSGVILLLAVTQAFLHDLHVLAMRLQRGSTWVENTAGRIQRNEWQ
jgi:hypothetical protein